VIIACVCALVPAVAAAADDAPITALSPVNQVAVPVLDGSEPSAGASLTPDGGATDDAATPAALTPIASPDTDNLDGTLAELRAAREQLVTERSTKGATLLQLEAARERAENRLDAASDAIAARLVALFDVDAHDELQALMAARQAADPDAHAAALAALAPADRALIDEQVAAAAAVATAGAAADDARAQVLALGTRIAAFDAAISARTTPDSADAGAKRGHHSIDSKYVFATGPIPSIGYWGDVSGGGLLGGWTGYAGAALGGVGCTAPDPTLRATGSIEQGDASWYGPGFNGKGTASGETYDQEAMTAAHKTLPFGTIVRVYSSQTGRCVFVRINDRGPYVDGRIIDLSHAASVALGMSGTASVQLEVWAKPGDTSAVTPPA
jgi:rare lipoprotein A